MTMTPERATDRRRGFTLIELMVGLVLLLAVGGVTYQLLVNTQRVTRSQGQRIGMQDNGRSGALILQSELREVGYDQMTVAARSAILTKYPLAVLTVGVNSDIRAMGPDSITYRAMRGLGYTCQFLSGTGDIVVYNRAANVNDPLSWQGFRQPVATDSLLVYVENDPSTASDDVWLTTGIGAPTAQNCPDGTTGFKLHLTMPVALGLSVADVLGIMKVGGPVRNFELMQVRSYTANGKTWLGMRARPTTNGTSLDPVIGPLAGTAGLAFTFRNSTNGTALVPDSVRSVQLTLRPMSDELVRTTGRTAKMDTLTMTTRVALRNALRP
jgi:prepilin-type N-terminal cleavage/methylation domain-containing protein